jgi:hypothetical protein
MENRHKPAHPLNRVLFSFLILVFSLTSDLARGDEKKWVENKVAGLKVRASYLPTVRLDHMAPSVIVWIRNVSSKDIKVNLDWLYKPADEFFIYNKKTKKIHPNSSSTAPNAPSHGFMTLSPKASLGLMVTLPLNSVFIDEIEGVYSLRHRRFGVIFDEIEIEKKE